MYDTDIMHRDFNHLAAYLEDCLAHGDLTEEEKAQAEADIKTCDEGLALIKKLEAIYTYVRVWHWDET